MPTKQQISVMAEHYLIAALWADAPEGTKPRITKQAREKARETCARFVELIGPLFDDAISCPGYGAHQDCGGIDPACAAMGHDLWLTSRGHGTGFWGRQELGDLGEELSAFCGWGAPIPDPQPSFYRGWLYL
jgi:hypothetical protein